MREVAAGTLAVGLADGDVEAAVADGVVRASEPARIAQFGEDRGRGDGSDAVELRDQCAATGLPAREDGEAAIDRCELSVEPVKHARAEVDHLAVVK